ncbi:MAG: HEAT repeat domain-containing protein [Chloroflexi bacterium]|nr:HEAT repeat domain-containing protein [Chloroflexota bacterium]
MPSVSWYRGEIARVSDRAELDAFVKQHSGLPGPRANLELAQAMAEEASEAVLLEFASAPRAGLDSNDPAVFPLVCGIVGLGRMTAEGSEAHWERLRECANDPCWRIREAVAMALQRVGLARFAALIHHTRSWRQGTPLEQRALAAGLCEPALLELPDQAREALTALDEITRSLLARGDRRSADVRILRQGLGYCWSVAVAALPSEGWDLLAGWALCTDPDVRWIIIENLKKKRLERLDTLRLVTIRASLE